MKRLLMALLSFALLGSLCGCHSAFSPLAEPITVDFDCQLSVETEGRTFTGQLTITSDQLTIHWEAPATIAGLILTCDGQTAAIGTADNVTVSGDAATLPVNGTLSVLWNVLRTADSAAATRLGEIAQITGNVTGGSYQLHFDPKTGFLLSLVLTSGDWQATFSEISVHKMA